jgi:ribose 1,5-bisphosphate isomerase
MLILVMDLIDKTVRDVKSLKIQGASKVREKSVKALVKVTLDSTAKTEQVFRKEFLKNSKKLFNARPTEPALRTALRIFKRSISNKKLNINEMKNIIKKTNGNYEMDRKRAMQLMTKYGSELIKKDSTILTICHSHAVVDVLIKAKKNIKKVYCMETRPLYQGRITAKELANEGIDVTLIVDNAASTVMKQCNYFFSGADAFLADGDIVNKIGTNQISSLCKKYDVLHYVITSTHKFEPSTFFGKDEPIEQRNPSELGEKISKVKILNPAFDRTDSDTIEGIICEKGVFPPQVIASKLFDDLKLDEHEKDFLKL